MSKTRAKYYGVSAAVAKRVEAAVLVVRWVRSEYDEELSVDAALRLLEVKKK